MNYTIKQAAEITGLTTDTLRYYEKEGVIFPGRSENGYRYYDENDILALKYIIVMKYANFTLPEIRSMEERQTHAQGTQCKEIAKQILSTKANELRQAISSFKKTVMLFEEIQHMIENADTADSNIEKVNELIENIFNDISRKKTR